MNKLSHESQNSLFLILLLLAAFGGVLYLLAIPPWQSPDEPTHFEYARVLASTMEVFNPHPDPGLQKIIIQSLDAHDYWRYVGVERPRPLPEKFASTPFLYSAPSQIRKNPPLYYLLAALSLRICPPESIVGEMYRLRVLSLIFSLLTVLTVFRAASLTFGNNYLSALAAAGFAAFLPQFTIIGTSVSPDPLTNLIGSAVVCLVLRLQTAGYSPGRVLLLAALHALGLMISYKFLILLPALFLAGVIRIRFSSRSFLPGKRLLTWTLLALSVLVFVYGGLTWKYPEIARLYLVRLHQGWSSFSRYFRGQTVVPDSYWVWFIKELFKSFWIKFGWLKFELPPRAYQVLSIGCGLSFLGIILMLLRWFFGKKARPGDAPALLLTLMVYAGISLGAYFAFWGLKVIETTTQARHLFLVLPAWAILFVRGVMELFPERWGSRVGIGILLGMIVLDAISLFGYIIPTYSR